MAQKRVIKIDLPELNRTKDQGKLTSGACRLTLETDKSYRGGVDATAQVSWVDERGFGSFVLGIGGGGDFNKTYKLIPGAATQKKIDTLHAQVFTPELIESIKAEVRSYYGYAKPTTDEQGDAPKQRLEYLRGELRAERISYDELSELQSLASHIDPADVELLEAAGVEETGQEIA